MRFRTQLSYDPGIDRLIGGDRFSDFRGRPVKSILLPLQRAERLHQNMQAFDSAYESEFESADEGGRPYPLALAVLEISEFPVEAHAEQVTVPVDDLFTADPLTIAPTEYRRLGQMITIVPRHETALGLALP